MQVFIKLGLNRIKNQKMVAIFYISLNIMLKSWLIVFLDN